jgi:hypothetical protein
LTDGIITDPGEISALQSALRECDANGIGILGVGLGTAPVHLGKLFPVCLHSPKWEELGQAFAAALGVSGFSPRRNITADHILAVTDRNFQQNAAPLIDTNLPLCPCLREIIQNQLRTHDFYDLFGDQQLITMNGIEAAIPDPQAEPYGAKVLDGFNILVVCLYLGKREKTNRITKRVFDQQCGIALARPGFAYDFVCSYGDALQKLLLDEEGHSRYCQLWLFSSDGYGELPEEAVDRDREKITPFLKAVTDFWENGGCLFLFCDNHPYTFEANYLMEHFLLFPDEQTTRKSKLRFGGYYLGQGPIRAADSEDPARSGFYPLPELGSFHGGRPRASLRPGLIEFYEGDTISYAVDPEGKPITDDADLWPWTPFAWSSEDTGKPRPFILYWDAPEKSEIGKGRGSIVCHGGSTSAFYEFGEDKGTARLIESIACWLSRIEERLDLQGSWSRKVPKGAPALTGKYEVSAPFGDWRKFRLHEVLLLDLSQSMEGCIGPFITEVNKFIAYSAQQDWVVSAITFNTEARLVYQRGTAQLPKFGAADCKKGTDYAAALHLAFQVIEDTSWLFDSRIIMVTDGELKENAHPTDVIKRLESKGIRVDSIFLRTDITTQTVYDLTPKGKDGQATRDELFAQLAQQGERSRQSLQAMVTCGGALRAGFVGELTELMIAAASTH